MLVTPTVATKRSSTDDIGPVTSTFARQPEAILEAHHLHFRVA